MAIKLTSTREAARLHGLKMTVYGAAGAGKTTLCATTGGPTVILSAEAGLLSLRDHDIPVIEVKTIEDVIDAYQFLSSSHEGKQFEWLALDSLSEIAEVVLAAEKKATRDPRQAYGALQEKMYELIRAFRDLPERNVYFSAKMLTEKVDIVETRTTGALTTNAVVGTKLAHGPNLPGTKLGQALPYFTDLIFAMRVEPDADGNPSRWLQTQPDDSYIAKDRSGCLAPFEAPDLSAIAAKVRQSSSKE
jgi:phage nucleotide-binding protein